VQLAIIQKRPLAQLGEDQASHRATELARSTITFDSGKEQRHPDDSYTKFFELEAEVRSKRKSKLAQLLAL
jgi:hypothetical protein